MVFRGRKDRLLRYPRCRGTARLPRLPCWPPFLHPKNSKGLSSEKKTVPGKEADEGGLSPTKDNDAASAAFGRWKACLPSSTDGILLCLLFRGASLTEQAGPALQKAGPEP